MTIVGDLFYYATSPWRAFLAGLGIGKDALSFWGAIMAFFEASFLLFVALAAGGLSHWFGQRLTAAALFGAAIAALGSLYSHGIRNFSWASYILDIASGAASGIVGRIASEMIEGRMKKRLGPKTDVISGDALLQTGKTLGASVASTLTTNLAHGEPVSTGLPTALAQGVALAAANVAYDETAKAGPGAGARKEGADSREAAEAHALKPKEE
eukprot:tig00000806_g4380.t1